MFFKGFVGVFHLFNLCRCVFCFMCFVVSSMSLMLFVSLCRLSLCRCVLLCLQTTTQPPPKHYKNPNKIKLFRVSFKGSLEFLSFVCLFMLMCRFTLCRCMCRCLLFRCVFCFICRCVTYFFMSLVSMFLCLCLLLYVCKHPKQRKVP